MVNSEEARKWLQQQLDSMQGAAPPPPPLPPDALDGHDRCPMCHSNIVGYDKRTISKGMGLALINHYYSAGTAFVHTRNLWLPHSKEAYELEWRGFIEPHPEKRGVWRVLSDGEAFVKNQHKVPKYARTRHSLATGRQELVELWGPEVGIYDLVPFDEAELLRSRRPF